ncbi:HAD-IA family hydrolase [Lysinibacillus sp. NPDC096418]|uniref:HAD-IA family hydrolase n=1 Tax=Lysinibacillus sp. NPDC096418 TaxID=3364138 RepID=UPI003828A7B6
MKHIIFDFDGTLADSTQVFMSTWNTLADKYQYKKIKLNELESLKKLSLTERSKLFNFPMYKIPIIIPQFYRLFRQSIKEIPLIDGMKDLLQELKMKGHTITIISSNDQENILEFLKLNKIDTVTNVICSSHIFGKDKIIHKYLKDQQLKPSEVIYVGDEQRDIVACKKVGVPIIWVSWGYDAIEVVRSEKPDFKVYAPAEILEII